jgi:hypothetical protein
MHLNVVGVHRDQRSNNLSYKKYAAYFDEPIANTQMNEFHGARLRRQCFLRYYPNDRTAAINFIKSDRHLDGKLGRLIELETSGASKQIKEFERYLCNKSFREGSERSGSALSNSILASTVMDSNDFTSVPRSGKAADFVYRVSLFEEPEVELSGKRFIVQDASCLGMHRADASSLEISDAAISTSLLLGQTYDKRNKKQFHVNCDNRGVPIIYLKIEDQSVDASSPLSAQNRKQHDNGLRPYRSSFVRAALLVTSSRKEAQLQVSSILQYLFLYDTLSAMIKLILLFISVKCLMTGSVKNATTSRADELLRPTLTILEYATSIKRENQAILSRDLKIGVNHIDRDQLRRNGILNPRYPTRLRNLKVMIDGVMEVKSNQPLDLLGPNTILYRVRCVAITEYIGLNPEDNTDDSTDLNYGDLLKEEWVVLRSFKDFTIFHKFLKTQVNTSESSVGTAAKLTGLATTALTLGSLSQNTAKRKTLIPSLNKAVQAGALGATKKCIEKRKEILNHYLSHLLSRGNFLRRCPELLRFIGAYEPLGCEVKLEQGVMTDYIDKLGRCEISKSFLQRSKVAPSPAGEIISNSEQREMEPGQFDAPGVIALAIDDNIAKHRSVLQKGRKSPTRTRKKKAKKLDPARSIMLASIKARVDCVKLSQVRGSVFELIRSIFDLDGANFFRSQMVSAMQTMSIAVTSGHGFKRTLMELHLKYLSSRSVASYIKFVKGFIWPNGVIFTSATPLTRDESEALASTSKILLRESFPDHLTAVLGHEISDNGSDLIHEMLNNRLVLKSMIYMMADTILLEAFPEMSDVLTCSQVLESPNA